MAQKVSITLNIPVRYRRIANGEKIIEQTGPEEIEVDISEGEAESWIRALMGVGIPPFTKTTGSKTHRRKTRPKRRKEQEQVFGENAP